MLDAKRNWPDTMKPIKWTDDFASIAALLDWSVDVDWQSIEKSRKSDAAKKTNRANQTDSVVNQKNVEATQSTLDSSDP